VTIAEEIEAHGVAGGVCVSETTRAALGDEYVLEAMPPIHLAGRGGKEASTLPRLMGRFFVRPLNRPASAPKLHVLDTVTPLPPPSALTPHAAASIHPTTTSTPKRSSTIATAAPTSGATPPRLTIATSTPLTPVNSNATAASSSPSGGGISTPTIVAAQHSPIGVPHGGVYLPPLLPGQMSSGNSPQNGHHPPTNGTTVLQSSTAGTPLRSFPNPSSSHNNHVLSPSKHGLHHSHIFIPSSPAIGATGNNNGSQRASIDDVPISSFVPHKHALTLHTQHPFTAVVV
jgi:hypothetical protein